jgi:hypothetical protein
VNLSGNQISDPGAIAIADMVAVNASLVAVDLDSNRIADSGGAALLRAVRANTHLMEARGCWFHLEFELRRWFVLC